MYPFTINHKSGSVSKIYTLCVATTKARDQWREQIENAKAIRRFDVENNRACAIHTIYIPREINVPSVVTADTFTWLGRETVAVAAGKSVWIGWRRDSHCQSGIFASAAADYQLTERSFVFPGH